jgi:hypothetical protein
MTEPTKMEWMIRFWRTGMRRDYRYLPTRRLTARRREAPRRWDRTTLSGYGFDMPGPRTLL